jgi:hypothetical protein
LGLHTVENYLEIEMNGLEIWDRWVLGMEFYESLNIVNLHQEYLFLPKMYPFIIK